MSARDFTYMSQAARGMADALRCCLDGSDGNSVHLSRADFMTIIKAFDDLAAFCETFEEAHRKLPELNVALGRMVVTTRLLEMRAGIIGAAVGAVATLAAQWVFA